MILALAAFFAVVAAMFLLPPSQRSRLRRQIAPHVSRVESALPGRGQAEPGAILGVTERWLENSSLYKRTERLLMRADVSMSAAKFLWLIVGCALLPGLLTGAVGAPAVVVAIFVVLGAAAPYIYARMKADRRKQAFEAQLSDVMDGIAAMLKAGHAFLHAFKNVADEGSPPISTEFGRALKQVELGLPLEEALDEMVTRVGSPDLDFVATSVAVQRQAGGSLADFFQLIASTVRERRDYNRRLRALTAVSRYSARILTILPFLVLFFLTMTRYSYVKLLFTTGTGRVLLILAAIFMTLGIVSTRLMTRVEG